MASKQMKKYYWWIDKGSIAKNSQSHNADILLADKKCWCIGNKFLEIQCELTN